MLGKETETNRKEMNINECDMSILVILLIGGEVKVGSSRAGLIHCCVPGCKSYHFTIISRPERSASEKTMDSENSEGHTVFQGNTAYLISNRLTAANLSILPLSS